MRYVRISRIPSDSSDKLETPFRIMWKRMVIRCPIQGARGNRFSMGEEGESRSRHVFRYACPPAQGVAENAARMKFSLPLNYGELWGQYIILTANPLMLFCAPWHA